MRSLFASLIVAVGVLLATPALAQFQPVELMCGDPPAPCSATNPLPVSPATGALSDVNLKQVNGVTTSTGAGAAGTGTQRVGVAQDITTIAGAAPGTAGTASANVVTIQGIAAMTKLLVTPDANSAVNIAQIAGATVATGHGVAATALRVELPTDGTGVVGLNAGTNNIGKTTTVPTNAPATVSAKTVTNSSAAFLTASAATTFLLIKNEDAAASIALNFANGTAVLNTAGNITLAPGASITFDSSFVPTGAITAISSAATSPATVIVN